MVISSSLMEQLAIYGRPRNCNSFHSVLTEIDKDCSHISGLCLRHLTAAPDGIRWSRLYHSNALKVPWLLRAYPATVLPVLPSLHDCLCNLWKHSFLLSCYVLPANPAHFPAGVYPTGQIMQRWVVPLHNLTGTCSLWSIAPKRCARSCSPARLPPRSCHAALSACTASYPHIRACSGRVV